MNRFTKVEFIRSYVSLDDLPREGKPEVALVGRSNVGKSSLINALANRRRLAQTSATPGKTRMLNYYLVDDDFYLVDLPGYGYAKVSQGEKRKWARLIEGYLTERDQLAGAIQLVDIRHPPTADDILMWRFLAEIRLPAVVVATKADKISRGQWKKSVDLIRGRLGLGQGKIIVFSAQTKEGASEIKGLLTGWASPSQL